MRGILLLVVVVGVLIGAGVISVKWNNDSATINFDREKARQRAKEVLGEAKSLESKAEQTLEETR